MNKVKLMLGDNISSLKKLPDNSIDSVVTDGPYGLSFMNKKWDYDVPSVEFWKEVYRVLKPGGHVLSFGGTRTYHRMTVNIEDAGFEIRDQIMWLYSTGFPKSHNISKAIDKNYGMIDQSILDVKNKLKELYKKSGKTITKINKECGFNAAGYIRTESIKPDPWVNTLPTLEKWKIIKNVINYNSNDMDNFFIEAERDVIGSKQSGLFNGGEGNSVGGTIVDNVDLTKSKTKEGQTWEGWGTALKPANEPICVARKPLSEKSVAENVLKWGTGGINIDGCRVGHNEPIRPMKAQEGGNKVYGQAGRKEDTTELKEEGRFPANIILECICDEVIKGEKGEVKEIKGLIKNNGEVYGGGKGKNTSDYISKCIVGDKGDIHTNPMCPCYMLDEQSGVSKSSKASMKLPKTGSFTGLSEGVTDYNKITERGHNDKGGASRFFYQAKVSKSERNMGLDGFEDKTSQLNSGGIGRKTSVEKRLDSNGENAPTTKNTHPTIKPVNLMAYLCRLVTPPNGIVLDPFMGSGSTGIAAQLEGFRFCGMELDEDYFKIVEARIENFESYRKFIKK
jgi:DNA modification methylase